MKKLILSIIAAATFASCNIESLIEGTNLAVSVPSQSIGFNVPQSQGGTFSDSSEVRISQLDSAIHPLSIRNVSDYRIVGGVVKTSAASFQPLRSMRLSVNSFVLLDTTFLSNIMSDSFVIQKVVPQNIAHLLSNSSLNYKVTITTNAPTDAQRITATLKPELSFR